MTALIGQRGLLGAQILLLAADLGGLKRLLLLCIGQGGLLRLQPCLGLGRPRLPLVENLQPSFNLHSLLRDLVACEL